MRRIVDTHAAEPTYGRRVMSIIHWKDGKKCFNNELLEEIQYGDVDKVRSMIHNQDVKFLRDYLGATLLHYAARYGNPSIAHDLLRLGVHVDSVDNYRRTPLVMAMARCPEKISMETIYVLLEAGADILKPDIYGRYPLQQLMDDETSNMKLLTSNFYEALAELYNNDAKIIADLLMKANCTLQRAIYLENAEVTEEMLKAGYSPNGSPCHDNTTPLHIAIARMDLNNIKLLFRYGADAKASIENGRIPLTSYFSTVRLTGDKGDPEIIKLLIDEYFRVAYNTEEVALGLKIILQSADADAIRYLLELDVDFSVRDSNDNTVLHYLAVNDNENVATAFQSQIRKSDMSVCNEHGLTPIHYAVMTRNSHVVQVFIDNGADVNEKSAYGDTPLTVLFFSLSLVHRKLSCQERPIVEMLLKHGATIQNNIPSTEGTLFDCMIAEQRYDLGELLVKQLVILEQCGEPIIQSIRNQIAEDELLNNIYKSCQRQLKRMKSLVIHNSITLFTLLTEDEETMIRSYAFNQELIDELQKFAVNPMFRLDYYNVLQNRLLHILPKIKLVQCTMKVLFQLMGPQVHKNYSIARKIIDCLDFDEMKELCAKSDNCNITL